MAAAGLGNMISDLAGIGLADQVETVCRRLGLPNPRLTPEQMKHSSTRWMALLVSCANFFDKVFALPFLKGSICLPTLHMCGLVEETL